jgi:hypothetical protein
MHTIWLHSVNSFKKTLNISAPRHHPQGIPNTNEYKQQHINIGSKMQSIKIFYNAL